jgi:hypothetical protein
MVNKNKEGEEDTKANRYNNGKKRPKKKHLREKENGKSSFVDDLKEHGKKPKRKFKMMVPLNFLVARIFLYVFYTSLTLGCVFVR